MSNFSSSTENHSSMSSSTTGGKEIDTSGCLSSTGADKNDTKRSTTATKAESDKLEGWLPITASRNAKWWYSTFHNVTAMVGAGVLGLPYAFSQLGWAPGMTSMVGSWLITYCSLWQLVSLHEVVPGIRFDRYYELGEYAFGPRVGSYVIKPQQMSVQVASGIVYMVTGGKSVKKFVDLLWPSFSGCRQTYYTLLFAVVQLVLSQTPNFNSLKGVSLIAAVMSFCYSAVAFITSTIKGTHHHRYVSYSVRSTTTAGAIFDAFNGLGTIAFAFAGHSVALEIQATIPSSPNVPSKKAMWRGSTVAYFIVAFCYLSVSASGYWAFGNTVEDDVLISLEKPRWLIAIANIMVFLHVVGSYQVFSMPVFDSIESYLVKKTDLVPGTMLRLGARGTYVALTALTAICIPFFGGLLGFFGGLFFTSISYFLPGMMWLKIQKPKRWSFHWIASWVSITVGCLIAILAPIGGARQIALSYNTFKMFS